MIMINKYHRIQIKFKKVGNKWKPVILIYLSKGGRRFNIIKAVLVVSGKVLTTNLAELEDDGYLNIVDKKYTLTVKGHQLATLHIQMLEHL